MERIKVERLSVLPTQESRYTLLKLKSKYTSTVSKKILGLISKSQKSGNEKLFGCQCCQL